MKTTLQIFILFAVSIMTAQSTHNLNWYMGISVQDASLEILEGDTVIWTLTDSAPHTVTSDGDSVETFDSGSINAGGTFSHTFTEVGDNPYFCDIHPSMTGVITVNATSGVEDFSLGKVSVYPNPASTEMTITISSLNSDATVRVVDLLGKTIHTQTLNALESTIDIAEWSSGVFVVEINDGKASVSKRIIKN